MNIRSVSRYLAAGIVILIMSAMPNSVWSNGIEPADSPSAAPIDASLSPDKASETALRYQHMKNRSVGRGRVPVIVKLRYANPPPFPADRAGLVMHRWRLAAIQDRVVKRIESAKRIPGNIQGLKRYKYTPAMALHVDSDELEILLLSPDVVDIFEDRAVPPSLRESVALVGGDSAWRFDGYTGEGQVVAVLDTGVDKTHPFLMGKIVSEACYSSNTDYSSSLCPGGREFSTGPGSGADCNTFIDGCGHGTHVAGIAAGKGGDFTGVAGDAGIISIQVFSRFSGADCLDSGYTSPCVFSWDSDQLRALERVYELGNIFNIAAVNISLGRREYHGDCDSDPRAAIINSIRTAGTATVIAAGNDGYVNALSSPACISSAVSVGSATKADTVSDFSNSSDLLDVLAPGSDILSSVQGGGFDSWYGTSMAAPHVAGAWAVFKQAMPDAGVDDILSALIAAGRPITDHRPGAGGRVRASIQIDLSAFAEITTVVLSGGSLDCTVNAGKDARIYGTSLSNHVTLESGARAILTNFPGQNLITLQASSNLFTVFRKGTMVTLKGSDGTILTIPASTDEQTIEFSDNVMVLTIHDNRVMLDDQKITTTAALIDVVTGTRGVEAALPVIGKT